jgi:hypothetical protein
MSNPLLLKKDQKKKSPFTRKKGKKVEIKKPLKAKAMMPNAESGGLVQGKKASSYEVYVADALDTLGLNYTFQKAVGGGRGRRGGQMLDFVVWSALTWVIDVRGGWWHRGSELEFEQAVRRYMKRAHVLVMKDQHCTSKDTALTFLRQNGVS